MTKMETYQAYLRSIDQWEEYLLKESGLPGPRGNIELAQVVADEGDEKLFLRYLTYTPDTAPTNSPYEFLAFCGVIGLGRLFAEGRSDYLQTLRLFASDPRWRIREAVAMALQRFGDADMDQLIVYMAEWAQGNPLEQRAAAAALCEPRLLVQPEHAREVLRILDDITSSICRIPDRRSLDFLALRKGLGYCWSVAVAALPEEGRIMIEKWLLCDDRDIRWMMLENLKKNRLLRMDAEWVERMRRS